MPQPVTLNVWSFPHQALLQRPQLATYIGAIAGEWTLVERRLVALMGNALGEADFYDNGGVAFTTNLIAYWMMETAETIRSRLSFIDATIGRLVAQSAIDAEWQQLKKDLRARSRERNRIVHAQWALSADYPDDLIMYDPDPQTFACYTLSDLVKILDRITALNMSCHDFTMRVAKAVSDGEIGGNVLRTPSP